MIFSFCGSQEVDYTVERLVFDEPHFKSTLMHLCLVSRAWSAIAAALLYEICFISSSSALEVFVRMLHRSQNPQTFIKSIAYLPPPSELYYQLDNPKTDLESQNLLAVMRTCQAETLWQLKVTTAQFDYLLTKGAFPADNLVNLHLVNPATSVTQMAGCVLPRCESLSVEYCLFQWRAGLPITPRLQRLRLENAHLGNELLADTEAVDYWRNLLTIELVHSYCGEDTLASLLLASIDTLQHLTLLNIRNSDAFLTENDFSSFKSLCSLCIGPCAFPSWKGLMLPPSLERLTIMESIYREVAKAPLPPPTVTEYNCHGLWLYLDSLDGCRDMAPALKKIYVYGVRYAWMSRRLAFTKRCRGLGIQFNLAVFGRESLMLLGFTTLIFLQLLNCRSHLLG